VLHGRRRTRHIVQTIILVQNARMDLVSASHDFDERRAARSAQQEVELRRLMAHQKIATDLLCASAAQQRMRIAVAARVVDGWEARGLCSGDYIQRWREWLQLPVRELAFRMCSAADGWGIAMRQNSPFAEFVIVGSLS
jgi:hypothetical protein